MRPVAFFLMGPTAAGKTAVAIRLAEIFPFEIISVDSAQVFRGLDIGSAKPSAAELEHAPHRLIDVADPTETFSAGRFRDEAQQAAQEIRDGGRIPLLAGGTMLYFRAYDRGLSQLPRANPEIRAEIDAEAARLGWPALHKQLATHDPVAAARIHPNDTQRIQRALEVHRLTGCPISELQGRGRGGMTAETVYRVAWCPSRETLYQRCEERLNSMIKNGFLDELATLYRRGDLHPDLPAIRAVGYRQFWDYCAGRVDLETARQAALVATRRLAKRQLTWLRAEPGVVWIDPARPGAMARLKRLAARVVQAARGE